MNSPSPGNTSPDRGGLAATGHVQTIGSAPVKPKKTSTGWTTDESLLRSQDDVHREWLPLDNHDLVSGHHGGGQDDYTQLEGGHIRMESGETNMYDPTTTSLDR